jgi:hypothetical protein
VHLTDMHLTGMYLMGMRLSGMYFMGMHLASVYLIDVYLSGVYRIWLWAYPWAWISPLLGQAFLVGPSKPRPVDHCPRIN